MEKLLVNPIGKIVVRERDTVIELDKKYIPALLGLEGFGCVQVLWWFNDCDNFETRSKLTEAKPYTNGPDILGIFSTRSPRRPNPIALTCTYVTHIDHVNGIVGLAYIDANNGSPVLDIKPYTPSIDRVENPTVPQWCAHWPKCIEESASFDWEAEFNF